MSFSPTQTVSNLDNVYLCMKEWSQHIPSVQFTKTRLDESFALIIKQNGSSLAIQVKEATAKHEYKRITEPTAFGPSESSERANLQIDGKDIEGKAFIFNASYFREKEGQDPWSEPATYATFVWKLSRL